MNEPETGGGRRRPRRGAGSFVPAGLADPRRDGPKNAMRPGKSAGKPDALQPRSRPPERLACAPRLECGEALLPLLVGGIPPASCAEAVLAFNPAPPGRDATFQRMNCPRPEDRRDLLAQVPDAPPLSGDEK